MPRDRLWTDIAVLLSVSGLLGLVRLGASDLPWIAPPPAPEDITCSVGGGDGEVALAGQATRISAEEAAALVGDPGVTFVDARNPAEFSAGHIPGAFNLPADAAEDMLDVQSLPIASDHLVITYCTGGACERSEYLGLLLQDRAVCEQVRVLDGGWAAWQEHLASANQSKELSSHGI